MNSLRNKVIGFLLLLAGVLGGGYGVNQFGSVAQGNDYTATSTRTFAGGVLPSITVLKSTGGTLARVTITGANTGIVRFWDATTTNVNLRSPNTASSSILVAEIPASAAAGTYDFDAEFKYGLIYELVGGLTPTSTVMTR